MIALLQPRTTQQAHSQTKTARLALSQAKTVQPELSQSGPVKLAFSQSGPVQLALSQAKTVQLAPPQADTTRQALSQAQTTDRALSQAETTDRAPSQAETTDRALSQAETTAWALSQAQTRRRALVQSVTGRHGEPLANTRQVVGQTRPVRPSGGLRFLPRGAHAAETELRAQRAVRRWTLLWLPVIACCVLGADLIVRNRSLLRADLLERRDPLLAGLAGVLVAAGLATFLATCASPNELARRTSLRWSALAAGPLSTLPVLFLATHGAAASRLEPHLDRWGFPCFFLAYLIAAVSLVVLARELRRLYTALASWRSAALASAAGSWSALALFVHCPGVQLEHLLVGHVLPICLLPLFGLWLARRCLRIV
jgi:hypothetical protein